MKRTVLAGLLAVTLTGCASLHDAVPVQGAAEVAADVAEGVASGAAWCAIGEISGIGCWWPW